MIEEVYQVVEGKRKRGFLGKVFLLSSKLAGGGIGSLAGTIVGAVYAVGKEVSIYASTQQIYPLQQLGLEYFAIVGGLSLTGASAGYYVSRKILDFLS